ncbi:MAG: bifunctional N(6)-L-threonylcarbamoyladenine synthase/serine/threonine protein kinase [Candidatus Aenigmarchaeota archaeon]|nr:bifunctional N(6)-L-threonylcarbamoyladenine synthase/serine/threonine protein kinase [Candidatus Aenigmarchaeota archaeon]
MICLGIESTAHSFSIGIVTDNGEVLSNETDMYKPKKQGWGIIPMEAAEHHKEIKDELLKQALEKANISMKDVDIISFSQAPGLPHCLYVGLEFAKELAKKYKKPLIGVYHLIAHIEIGKLFTKSNDPIVTFTSGANTQILGFAEGKYRQFGETNDIGIGNAMDKLGRELGIGFPAGPKIEELAKKGSWTELPYTVKGMDLSFSGILSECARKFKNKEKIEDICFSFQETCFAMLTEVTERALAHTGKSEVLLTGGVAANKRLQEMLEIMCKERGAKFFVCPREYCGDCGANIAWTGLLAYKFGQKPLEPEKAEVYPRQRTDEVDVVWMK